MAAAPSVDNFFNYKCPTEILEVLTEEQREKIDTLRTILGAAKEGDATHTPVLRPEHDDDYQLHRFLHAKEYDVGKAREMYEKMVSWRREFGTDALLADFRIDDTYTKVKKDYIHFYYRTDKLGRPVYIEQLGKLNMAGIKVRRRSPPVCMYFVRERTHVHVFLAGGSFLSSSSSDGRCRETDEPLANRSAFRCHTQLCLKYPHVAHHGCRSLKTCMSW